MTTCHVLIYKIAFISVYSPVSVADYTSKQHIHASRTDSAFFLLALWIEV